MHHIHTYNTQHGWQLGRWRRKCDAQPTNHRSAPKLVQRLRPLLIPIECGPAVGGCRAAIVGFAKPDISKSDHAVSDATGDRDSTFDAELQVLSRAQMSNTRVSVCARYVLCATLRYCMGDAAEGLMMQTVFMLCRQASWWRFRFTGTQLLYFITARQVRTA